MKRVTEGDSDAAIMDVGTKALELLAEGIGNGSPGATGSGVQKRSAVMPQDLARADSEQPIPIPHQSSPLQKRNKG